MEGGAREGQRNAKGFRFTVAAQDPGGGGAAPSLHHSIPPSLPGLDGWTEWSGKKWKKKQNKAHIVVLLQPIKLLNSISSSGAGGVGRGVGGQSLYCNPIGCRLTESGGGGKGPRWAAQRGAARPLRPAELKVSHVLSPDLLTELPAFRLMAVVHVCICKTGSDRFGLVHK